MDIYELNRINFRSLLKALSYPGDEFKLWPVYDSFLLAAFATIVSPESTYYLEDQEKTKELAQILVNAQPVSLEKADYIFCNQFQPHLLLKAKTGTSLYPEQSATLFFCPPSDLSLPVCLKGPGILNQKHTNLPVSAEFIDLFLKQNQNFPLGLDVFLITKQGTVIGLPRTIYVEVR